MWGSLRSPNKVIPLMKQPRFKSIFVSNAGRCIEFGELRKLIHCFLLNVAEHKQTISLSVGDVTSIDHSHRLRCSEGSCKSFLCSTSSKKFYKLMVLL